MIDRPRCACGNLCKKNGVSRLTGLTLYNSYCRSCAKTRHGTKDIRLKRHKKSVCNICGFVPVHHCQLDVDHIDGNGLNCKKENLREATPNQNMMNSRKRIDNSSGHKGVSWSKSAGKWEAYIRNGGKKLYLGIFEDINEASIAYVIASQKYHKEYGRVE